MSLNIKTNTKFNKTDAKSTMKYYPYLIQETKSTVIRRTITRSQRGF